MLGWMVLGSTLLQPVSPVSATDALHAAPSSVTTQLVLPVVPSEPPLQIFNSPDGAFIVWIAEGHGGVVLDLMDKDKHELASDEHAPEDRPGGYAFAHGGWTADSEYFVYSTVSWRDSGNPRIGNPIYVYSRSKNAFYALGDCIGAIGSPIFTLSPPHLIDVEMINDAAAPGKMARFNLRVVLKAVCKVEESRT